MHLGLKAGKVSAVKAFLESDDKILITTHATFRFAVEEYGHEILTIDSLQWMSFITYQQTRKQTWFSAQLVDLKREDPHNRDDRVLLSW